MFKTVIRLWPTYFASITLTFIITLFFPLPDRTCTFFEYLLNIIFINGYIGIRYVDSAHWYITILLSLTFVTILIKKFNLDYFVTYILWFALGIVLFSINQNAILRLIGGSYIGVAFIGVGIRKIKESKIWVIILALGFVFTYYVFGIRELLCLCFAGLIVFGVIRGKIKIFENKFFLFFAAISYPLYLCHQNIGYVIQYYLNVSGKYNWVFSFVASIVVILLSVILHYCVEKPAGKVLVKGRE